MNEPLAYRVRPKTLEEYVGQEHVLGKAQFNKISQNIIYSSKKRTKNNRKNIIAIGGKKYE